MSFQVPYYHFRKWSKDGSLQRLFDASIISIKGELNLSELNLDGSHSAAKKGAKTLPIKDERRPRPATSSRYPTETAPFLQPQASLLAIIMMDTSLFRSSRTSLLT
jgi:hypothetical protein